MHLIEFFWDQFFVAPTF